MENIAIESWLVIMGMSGLALGLVVGVTKLVRRLFAPKRKLAQKRPPELKQQPQFEDEVRIRVFRQQADKAFQSISAVIDEEYKTLLTLVESGQNLMRPSLEPQPQKSWKPLTEPALSNRLARQYNDAPKQGPYAQIEKYVSQGLSTGEISEVLQIPNNEVELAVKLRSARHAAFNR